MNAKATVKGSTPKSRGAFEHEIILVDLDELELDPDNPRLKSLAPGAKQSDLVKCLYSEMALDELAWSISENGFFPQEPLYVTPVGPKDRSSPSVKYRVVEGNRRFAAVLLLVDDNLRKSCKASDLPDITKSRKASLKNLPVIVYPSKESLWEYLGFRHINGVKAWDPLSKALYIAEVHEDYGISLDEIAQRIGDRHTTVKRMYKGLVVLRQAEANGFNKEDRIMNSFSFSHLYTGLDYKEIQRFIGVSSDDELPKNPVPRSKRRELIELMHWLYGSKSEGKQRVVAKQNPDLGRLRDVLGSAKATAELRASRSLTTSYNIALGDERRFEDAVYGAEETLKQALAVAVTGFNRRKTTVHKSIENLSALIVELTDRTINKASK